MTTNFTSLCPYCRRRVRVEMHAALVHYYFARHMNRSGRRVCLGSSWVVQGTLHEEG